MMKWTMKLQARERMILMGGGLFLLLVVLFKFVYAPLLEGKERYQRGIRLKEKQYVELLQLKEEYKSMLMESQSLTEQLRNREPGFSLFAFLEKASDEAGVKPHIKYMKPSLAAAGDLYKESQVEMKLEQITIAQLVEYLKIIESAENVVFVKRISIKKSSDGEGFIEVILQATTYV